MNHHLNHYLIGAAAVVLGAVGIYAGTKSHERVEMVPVHAHRVSRVWQPLTDDQSKTLESGLASFKNKTVIVMYADPHGEDLADDIGDAFKASGAKVSVAQPPYYVDPGFHVLAPTDGEISQVTAAFQSIGLVPEESSQIGKSGLDRVAGPTNTIVISIGKIP